MSLRFHWFLPTNGDGRDIVGGGPGVATGSAGAVRPASLGYLGQVARSAEQLGFEAALTPTGVWCEDAWLVTGMLTEVTERLNFIVAFRPGLISPMLAAQMAATFQRYSSGRLLLNVVTGGEAAEQRAYGDFLGKAQRYQRCAEFLDIVTRLAGRTLRYGIRLHVVTRDTAHEAWLQADRLIERVDEAMIRKVQEGLAYSESDGQRRMRELHGGSRDDLEVSPNLWAGVGLLRGGAGTALVGSHAEVADRIEEYAALGVSEFILSGYPHLEEAYWFGEGVLPILRQRGRWQHPAPEPGDAAPGMTPFAPTSGPAHPAAASLPLCAERPGVPPQRQHPNPEVDVMHIAVVTTVS